MKPHWSERERDLYNLTGGRFSPDEGSKLRKPEPPVPSPQCPEEILCSRVSVICPTTDSRHDFHAQLWHVFDAQDWADKELIVVETWKDRPSPFFTEKARTDDRIIYVNYRVPKEADWSIGLKRNICAHLASGVLVAHFDDDDIYAPNYLREMVTSMVDQRNDAITLSTYFVYDVRCGKFGWTDQRYASEQVRYGYGFSYVFFRWCVMLRPYPNQNLGEDFDFFNGIRKLHGSSYLQGDRRVGLFVDESGICCHTLHPTATSNVHAKRQVPQEEVLGLDFGRLPIIDAYLTRCPPTSAGSAYIGKLERRKVKLQLESSVGAFDVNCCVGDTAGHVAKLLHAQMQCGGSPSQLRLHRRKPPCLEKQEPPPPPGESASSKANGEASPEHSRDLPRKKRVLAIHAAASNSNVMHFQTAALRKALEAVLGGCTWLFPEGPIPWTPFSEEDNAKLGKECPGMQGHFEPKSSFEERVAQGKPFSSWCDLAAELAWAPTPASLEASARHLIEYIMQHVPIDMVVAIGQGAHIMVIVSMILRQELGYVPWRLNLHFGATPPPETWVPEESDARLETPTFLINGDTGYWDHISRTVYPKVFSNLAVIAHQDQWRLPTTRPQATDIYERLAVVARSSLRTQKNGAHSDPHSDNSSSQFREEEARREAIGDAPPLSESERMGPRESTLFVTWAAQRREDPDIEVMVRDIRDPEETCVVKVHSIELLSGLREALLEQHGGSSSSKAAREVRRDVKLAERVGKPDDDEGFYFKACILSKFLLQRREFYASGLGALQDQAASERGSAPKTVRVSYMQAGQFAFVFVEVPGPARLRTLRSMLGDRWRPNARAWRGGQLLKEDVRNKIPMSEDALLPAEITVEDLKTESILGSFELAVEAQERILDALAEPWAQDRLQQLLYGECNGDQNKYRTKLTAILSEEIYSSMLDHYGLPHTKAAVFCMSQSITNWMSMQQPTDPVMVLNWLRIERLCLHEAGVEKATAALKQNGIAFPDASSTQ